MEEFKLLKNISGPADVKKLKKEELPQLADEIRQVLINTVSKNGGHLASNLGVVELSIALHRVFCSPYDKIVWDVGHQCYVHKLLTGRFDRFDTIRTEGGLSGFCRPDESEHDTFYSGHSSTSISAAYGIAAANKLKGNKNYTIAVIGDGSFTGGLVYEALNNAGRSKTRLIVILNDNDMSISRNVGALARYFAAIKARPGYFRLKAKTEQLINKIPFVGKKLSITLFRIKTYIKNMIYKSTIFEDFGFRYMGPINGHNINQLIDALEGAKAANHPVVLHINTVKGKGYDHAEKSPEVFHGISQFDINTGEPLSAGTNFSAEFGRFLIDVAEKDRRICAITAAMSVGTGLDGFAARFPDRFFDVGIAEAHAVTFASGLAKAGMVPVFAVYSSFLQRAYDQLIHDGALQRQKMIIAVDRAGFVGEDGETHQGIFDVAFLNSIPNVTVYSPSTYAEMRRCFINAFYHQDGLAAVRYARGTECILPDDFEPTFSDYEVYGDKEADTVIVTYGRLFGFAAAAVRRLKEQGIPVMTLKLTKIKPIDKDAVTILLGKKEIFFFEEGVKSGSVGERLALILKEQGYEGEYTLTAVNDSFVPHAPVKSLLKRYKLDTDGMCEIITQSFQKPAAIGFEP
ncbi:MAG TPA: 1-deoxy-D-xylulose-5-phosphate synthase [Clostridiales bacterium]|nr:1-deoxy-D-xylulose-5-phosphate synthase [Clostridiales bacterium]